MLVYIKLILLAILLVFANKATGLYLSKKLKIRDAYYPIGFFANLALFFVLMLPVMLLKLSYHYMMISGGVLLLINLYCLIKERKELFEFSKTEVVSLLFAFFFSLLFFIIYDFGAAETYDSYFYNIFSNIGSRADRISVIDPYTGMDSLQHFYKYISYYYLPSFYSNLLGIKPASLILNTVFVFLNFYFASTTAFNAVKTKDKYYRLIAASFLLTLVPSMFRAPQNALFILALFVPIYLFRQRKNFKYLFIIFLACTSVTSTSLFLLLSYIYILFILYALNDIKKFKRLFVLVIPSLVLLTLYVYESTSQYLVLLIVFVLLLVIYLLLNTKTFNKMLVVAGRLMLLLVPIILVVLPHTNAYRVLKTYVLSDPAESIVTYDVETYCSAALEKDENTGLSDNLSSSIDYIYKGSSSRLNTFLIRATHTVPKYLLIFLGLYLSFKKQLPRRKLQFFLIYAITFANPLVQKGLSIITSGLEARLSNFYLIFFAFLALYYFIKAYDKNERLNKIIKPLSVVYLFLVLLNILSFTSLLKPLDKSDNYLYKVPNYIVDASHVVNDYLPKERVRVFYASPVFNISLIDEEPNNKVKVFESREYMNYVLNDKAISYPVLVDKILNEESDKYSSYYDESSGCKLSNLLDTLSIDYLVLQIKNEELRKYMYNKYESLYEDEYYSLIKVK